MVETLPSQKPEIKYEPNYREGTIFRIFEASYENETFIVRDIGLGPALNPSLDKNSILGYEMEFWLWPESKHGVAPYACFDDYRENDEGIQYVWLFMSYLSGEEDDILNQLQDLIEEHKEIPLSSADKQLLTKTIEDILLS